MMLPWPLLLLVAGLLLAMGSAAAVGLALGRAIWSRRVRRERARRRLAQAELRQLEQRLEWHRRRAHRRPPRPHHDDTVILPGLFAQADQALEAEADTVLMQALTPAAIAAYDQLRRQP